MANYGGTDRTGYGPAWRRQHNQTLPGERTAADLALVNEQRRKMGLPPLGGPAQRTAMPGNPGPSRPFIPGTGFPGGPPLGGGGPGRRIEGPGFDPYAGGVGPMQGEPGAAPPGAQQGAGLGSLQLPQLLALRAMFAKATGQQGRPAMPAMPVQRSVLPQLHQAVPVRAHVRIVPPRPALGPQNLPSHLRGAYPA